MLSILGRNDRDLYVTIDWNNVAENAKDSMQFRKFESILNFHSLCKFGYSDIFLFLPYIKMGSDPDSIPSHSSISFGTKNWRLFKTYFVTSDSRPDPLGRVDQEIFALKS
jgi:hypothetical protein